MEFFNPDVTGSFEFEIATRLVVAMLLGLLLGAERIIARKSAGMRTYAMVALGSALFVGISDLLLHDFQGVNYDPLRMAAQVVAGIGFLGAGLIIVHGKEIRGLTTAAGLWVTAGIGMAAGFGIFSVAFIATALALFIFTVIWFVEIYVRKISDKSNLSE